MEGAEAPEVLVALGQADVLLDDLDQVDFGLDLGEGVIGRWMWRIVANVAKDSYRARARRLAMWRRLVGRWHEPVGAVEDRALDAIANAELIKAIRNLNDRDRLLIALRFGADLDLGAVGDATGLTAHPPARPPPAAPPPPP